MNKLIGMLIAYIFSAIIYFSLCSVVFAAPSYDQTNGTYNDDFSNTAGLSTTNQKVNVNTGTGKLQLTNSGDTFSSPYVSTGYAITSTIAPTSVAKWGTFSYTANIPANTSVNVQILDESNEVFPDSLLPGNTAGFTDTIIDLSNLSVTTVAFPHTGNSKFARIKFKFTFTSDTSATPEIDSINFTWTVNQGDLSASPMANAFNPTMYYNQQGNKYLNFSGNNPEYMTLRWVKNTDVFNSASAITRGTGNDIYVKTGGGSSWDYLSFTLGHLMSLNRLTGETNYEKAWSGTGYSDSEHTLSLNGGIYISDVWNDILVVHNANDGSIRWTHQYSFGHHGYGPPKIDNDGIIYDIRLSGADTGFVIYAYNPDGSIKYQTSVPNIVTSPNKIYVSDFLIDNGKLFISSTVYNSTTILYTNEGILYAYNTSDGTQAWTYPTGDVRKIIIGGDHTIYAVNSDDLGTDTSSEKKAFAFNPNGSLIWSHDFGNTKYTFYPCAITSTNTLLIDRKPKIYNSSYAVIPENLNKMAIVALNTSDGSEAWTKEIPEQSAEFCGIYDNAGIWHRASETNTSTYSTVSSNINLYDYDGINKFKFKSVDSTNAYFSPLSFDEDGNLYTMIANYTGRTSKLMAFRHWTQTVTSNLTDAQLKTGDAVNFTVTTTMLPTNLYTNETNKLQVYVDNGDTSALTFQSTDENGISTWTGSYTVPIYSTLHNGTHSYFIEAASSNTSTDIPVHFSSAPTGSGNTGIRSTGTFTVKNTIPDKNLTSVNLSAIQNEISDGGISYEGDSATESSSFTFNSNYSFASGSASVVFPSGTVATKVGGGTIDLTSFITTDITEHIKTQLSDSLGAIKLGIPSIPLTFSKDITINISVGENYNGQTLSVYYQTDLESEWHKETTCTVTSGLCVFNTNHATTFTARNVAESNSSNSSITPSSTNPPDCHDEKPSSAPDLFQINTTDSEANLFFTPINNTSSFFISYSTNSNAEDFSADPVLASEGVQSYIIKSLKPNTVYYFKVRGQKGCMPGEWSNILKIKTQKSKSDSEIKFYKNNTSDELQKNPNKLNIVSSELKYKKQENTSCNSYEVKSGDSLWNIATKLLGNGSKYKEIIENNKDKYSSLLYSSNLTVGWKLEINCSKKNNSEKNNGYLFKVKVTDKNNKPIKNATVTVYSTPKTSKTNNEGIAIFKNIEQGSHKVVVKINNSVGEESVNLTGNIKSVELDIKVNKNNFPMFMLTLLFFTALATLVIFTYKKLFNLKRKN